VNDVAVPDFMTDFYRLMKEGNNPGQALRQAKLDMLASGVSAYQHPYYWAPFDWSGLSELLAETGEAEPSFGNQCQSTGHIW
jgi:hypothetical protein